MILTIRLERVAKTAPLSRAVLPALRAARMRQLSHALLPSAKNAPGEPGAGDQ